MRTIFMGSPDFALPALKALMLNKYNISAVYTQPDKRTGRGQKVVACPVKQFAVENGLRVIQPDTLRHNEEIETLKDLHPDIIIVAAYGQILPDTVLQIPKYQCLNIHPSLLPKYRGPSPISEALINGDETTGVTIMLVEKEIDSGPILNQREVIISEKDTAESLSMRLSRLGAELLIETIPDWIQRKIEPRIQNENQASYTRLVVKEDGKLDWNLPAVSLWHRIRAYYPWPGCYALWKGIRIKISEAVPVNYDSGDKPGLAIILPQGNAAAIGITTGAGSLGLLRVQPEGKKEMTAKELVAGHRDFIGSILT